MKKYQVTVEIISGANKGVIVTTELFAKDKEGALYRTHTLLASDKEYNILSIEEVTEKQYKHWSKEQCDKVIKEYKDNTMYFNEQMTFDEVYNMFRLHYEFWEAETKVIMAALMKAGAKFR